jgi:hypothetical protein
VPVSITTHGGSLEEAKERTLAELRQQGEKREIFFDELVIDTGVPRSREYYERGQIGVIPPRKADDAQERTRAPEGEALRASEGFRAKYRPPQVNGPATEPCRVRATIKLPRARLRKVSTK